MARMLFEAVRETFRLHHYRYLTEKTDLAWIQRLIRFNGKRRPQYMGAPDIQALLSSLAVEGHVSASTS